MFRPKYKFTYEEVRIIVLALIDLKNQRNNSAYSRRRQTADKVQVRVQASLGFFHAHELGLKNLKMICQLTPRRCNLFSVRCWSLRALKMILSD